MGQVSTQRGQAFGGERERGLQLIACRSPAGSLEYGLFYKAMRGGVESQGPGVTAGSRTLVCARPADGRIQQAFPRKFTAGDAWLSRQTMDEKVVRKVVRIMLTTIGYASPIHLR